MTIVIAFIGLIPALARTASSKDCYVMAEVSNSNPYEGEAVVLSYSLYTRVADIRFARRVEEPGLLGENNGSVSQIEIDSRGRREIVGGETYYVFPLESYLVSADRKGNFRLEGGSFEVGINYPVIVDDPFWGRRRAYQTENRVVQAPEVNIKVKSLPSGVHNKDTDKSVAVGAYTVTTVVPPGEIILDRPARAIIILKGRGLLGGEVLPLYADAFKGEDIKLKSMAESRKTYFDGKGVVSELTLDCEFIPLAKSVTIGEVKFAFFNPFVGKYVEVSSAPVEVKAKSITSKVETVDI